MNAQNDDLDFCFEGQTYRIAPLTDKGRRWLAAEGLSEIVRTVGINKIRRDAIAAGLQTLVSGNAHSPHSSLQERPEDIELARQARLRSAAFERPWWSEPEDATGAMDRALVQGALAGSAERCPYKRNTRKGKRLAARWEQGRAIAAAMIPS